MVCKKITWIWCHAYRIGITKPRSGIGNTLSQSRSMHLASKASGPCRSISGNPVMFVSRSRAQPFHQHLFNPLNNLVAESAQCCG